MLDVCYCTIVPHHSLHQTGLTADLADSQPKSFGLVLRQRPLGPVLQSSNEPGALLQWLCHDDSTINIVLELLLLLLLFNFCRLSAILTEFSKRYFGFTVLNEPPLDSTFFLLRAVKWSYTIRAFYRSFWMALNVGQSPRRMQWFTVNCCMSWQMLAFAVLDTLLAVDSHKVWFSHLSSRGYLQHIVDSLLQDDDTLRGMLSPQPEPLRALYIFQSKIVWLFSSLSVHCCTYRCWLAGWLVWVLYTDWVNT